MSDKNEAGRGMSKAERLAIAAAVAPILRTVPESLTKRRVKFYSLETGATTREGEFGEVLRGLAKDYAISRAVDEAEAREVAKHAESKLAMCLQCGLEFTYPKTASSKPASCPTCRALPCDGGCGKPSPQMAMRSSGIKSRGGRPWTCGKCAAKKRAADPDYLEKSRARARDPEFQERFRARMREVANDPEWQEKQRRLHADEAWRAKIGERSMESMKSEEARKAASERGRKGAASRWQKGSENGR